MLKKAVTLATNGMPSWAWNYLNRNGLYSTILQIRPKDRYRKFRAYFNRPELAHISKQIYCNKKGQVVFTWETGADRTMFVLKWG